MKTTFIVPVYNEAATIAEVNRAIQALPLEKEIIVVDDGSSDTTPKILEPFGGQPDIVLLRSETNHGKGSAIRLGLPRATGDIVAIQDGDLEYDVRDYLKIIEKFNDPDVAVVYGSRFQNGFPSGMQWRFKMANRLLRWLANVLYDANITDEATAYKAFRRDVIASIPLRCQRFEFCPEVTALLRKRGYTIQELPICYRPRGRAEGKKIKWTDGLVAVWMLIRLQFLRKIDCNQKLRDD